MPLVQPCSSSIPGLTAAAAAGTTARVLDMTGTENTAATGGPLSSLTREQLVSEVERYRRELQQERKKSNDLTVALRAAQRASELQASRGSTPVPGSLAASRPSSARPVLAASPAPLQATGSLTPATRGALAATMANRPSTGVPGSRTNSGRPLSAV